MSQSCTAVVAVVFIVSGWLVIRANAGPRWLREVDEARFAKPTVTKPITISGAPGDDAKHYQIRAVRRAIEDSKS